MRLSLPFLCAAAIAAGCGGVVVAGQSGATSGSGGATTTTTTAGSGGGIGGGGIGGGIIVGSSSSGGTTFDPTCGDPTIFLDIAGDGPPQHIDASCAPHGYLIIGGGAKPPPPPPPPPPPTPATLIVEACNQSTFPVQLYMSVPGPTWPGPGPIMIADYQRGGVKYQLAPGNDTLNVTLIENVGGVIEGSYTALFIPVSAADGGASLVLSGTFRVCRWPDVIPV